MENEMILSQQENMVSLLENAINKLSGKQVLELTAIGMGGTIIIVGIMCLKGYDFCIKENGISFSKHDETSQKKAA